MSAVSLHEVLVKRLHALSFPIVMTLVFLAGGCRWGKSSSADPASPATTQTIAPAAARPAPNGGDAVTQTVDVEDGRSEDDGGVLTNPQAAKTPGTAKAPSKKPSKTPVKTPAKTLPKVQPKKH